MCENPTNTGNFLAHLSDSNLAACTVLGYQSAICTTLNQWGGHNVTHDPLLKESAKGLVSSQTKIYPQMIPLLRHNLWIPPKGSLCATCGCIFRTLTSQDCLILTHYYFWQES